MHCVNHPETDAQSFCQHCGKPLCANCVRTTPTGQIFCETCFAATGGGAADPSQAYWQSANVPPGQVPPMYGIPPRGPNPSAAALLGLIPGVGAMYNGQLFKGLIHVVIFAVLVSITDHYAIFGLFIAAWVLYQSFEAYHTAKARRDGMPVPDPFGLNELGSWLNMGSSSRATGVPPGANPSNPVGGYAQTEPPPYSAPYTSSWSDPVPGAGPGPSSGPAANPGYAPGPGPIPPQPPYADPFTGANPGGYNPGPYVESYPPPIPPVPPPNWRRREPIFAFVLIGLGIIFLLQSLGFVTHLMHYIWPLMLIGLGVWLIVRRVGYTQGGSK